MLLGASQGTCTVLPPLPSIALQVYVACGLHCHHERCKHATRESLYYIYFPLPVEVVPKLVVAAAAVVLVALVVVMVVVMAVVMAVGMAVGMAAVAVGVDYFRKTCCIG